MCLVNFLIKKLYFYAALIWFIYNKIEEPNHHAPDILKFIIFLLNFIVWKSFKLSAVIRWNHFLVSTRSNRHTYTHKTLDKEAPSTLSVISHNMSHMQIIIVVMSVYVYDYEKLLLFNWIYSYCNNCMCEYIYLKS